MTTTKLALCFLVVLAATGGALRVNAEKASEIEFSEAEILLWLTDQLQVIKKPTTLSYRFERTGTYDAGFTDEVVFKVTAIKPDGMKAASLDFFSGERRFEVPAAERTNINPVLKVYLQGDVYEMNRLTDPEGESRERWRYFQRRIKFALAESAQVEDFSITFDGRDYPAKRITFTPYLNDPKRSSFEEFADKIYVVVVSDELPGYLYKIETVVPGPSDVAPPRIKETLTLESVQES